VLSLVVQVRETTRAVKFLHNTNFFAAAQEKCAAAARLRVPVCTRVSHLSTPRYVYIYDKRGLEVHCLREHERALALEFLNRFFLLASVGESGCLRYQDTSTGAIVAQHRTRLGRCEVLCANGHNGVLQAGHGNGTVSLWSPSSGTPLVSLLAHRGAVRALACDGSGRHLVSAGQDGQVKVWDLRTFKPLHAYFSATPASSLAVSQRGMLAVGYGPHVQVWRDALGAKAHSPYLSHLVQGGGTAVHTARFCPYDDVLGVGHSGGVSSLLVRPRRRARGHSARTLARTRQLRPPGGLIPRRRGNSTKRSHTGRNSRAGPGQISATPGAHAARLTTQPHTDPPPARRCPAPASPTTTPSWPTRTRRISSARRRRFTRCWTSCSRA